MADELQLSVGDLILIVNLLRDDAHKWEKAAHTVRDEGTNAAVCFGRASNRHELAAKIKAEVERRGALMEKEHG